MRIALLAAAFGAHAALAQSQQPGAAVADSTRRGAHDLGPLVTAVRVTAPIRVDGMLDDDGWISAAPATEFIQSDPRDGQPSTERTEVRFLYDDEALYVGARMWDERGDVRSRMGRRDSHVEGSDWLYVMFDSHHNHLTAYQFSVNPHGVKRDELNTGTMGQPDASWDAVWDLATRVDSAGWTAELRIPFSQLRFPEGDAQNWGIQIQRRIIRKQELASFAFTPKSERGGVARYGHLHGLRGLKPGRPMEVMPYAVAQAEFMNVNSADPFRSEREGMGGAGIDLKYRLTSSLTIDGTLNPDFGQVEQDPAVVNLTAFETSFNEKRPFFVEGNDVFNFGENARLFYSRRIGRPPQGSMPGETRFADRPDASTILAAAKLSGRTNSGWNIGLLDAVTQLEQAPYILTDGTEGKQIVEPYTNYLVGRAKKDFRSGQTSVGLIGTAVHRKLETEALASLLRSSAYLLGTDFNHEFLNRTWSTNGYFALSRVAGSPEAILRTQLSSARYFQRPDAEYVDLDSSATSLTGYTARFEVGKRAGLHWRGEANVGLHSPDYEINDAGFQTSVDRINAGGNVTYVENRPGKTFQNWRVSVNPRGDWNFGHEFQGGQIGAELNGQLVSYWGGQLNVQYRFAGYDDRLTRGGPSVRELAGRHVGWELHSDNRKRVTFRTRGNYSWGESGGWHKSVGGNISIRPGDNWSLSVGPSYNQSRSAAQYLNSIADTLALNTFGRRYLFAPIDQTSLSMETRFNFNFTPNLSFDLFAQPFVSTGDYGLPMQLHTAREFEFDRFSVAAGTLSEADDSYTIDPDVNGPADAFSVAKRDFTTRSLRGNAVLRWEWRPGSTMFLVWQQRRSLDASSGGFDLGHDVNRLFRGKPESIFLIKVSYWLNP